MTFFSFVSGHRIVLSHWGSNTRSKLIVDQLKPISSAYARYAPSATFHDPIGLAEGLEAVVRPLVATFEHQTDKQKAQFNSMPKIFASSETKALKVLDNPAVVSCVRLHIFDRTSPRLQSYGPTDKHPLIPATPFDPVLPFAAVQAQGDQLGKARRVAYHPPR